jgi:hypothetical protein
MEGFSVCERLQRCVAPGSSASDRFDGIEACGADAAAR